MWSISIKKITYCVIFIQIKRQKLYGNLNSESFIYRIINYNMIEETEIG